MIPIAESRVVSKQSNLNTENFYSIRKELFAWQGWKLVGLPVGSRFFDRPVNQVEKPVKFSFPATKRHLGINRNMHIYFIINKSFHKKKSINKPNLLKALAEWFQAFTNMLRPLRNAHPGAYLGRALCHAHPLLGHGTKQNSAKYTLKSGNQIIIKH